MLVTGYKKTNEETCFKVKPYVPVVYYEKSTKKDTTLVDSGEWLSTRIHGGYLKLSFYYWPELFESTRLSQTSRTHVWFLNPRSQTLAHARRRIARAARLQTADERGRVHGRRDAAERSGSATERG